MVTKWSSSRVPDYFFCSAGLHFAITIKINLMAGTFYSVHAERQAA
jgi:hypothetical protein